MGCFSYICGKCNRHIFSDKYNICEGEEVRLGRLVEGKIVEWMKGRYDSYGRVHTSKDSEHFIRVSSVPEDFYFLQLNPTEDELKNKCFNWKSESWSTMVEEHFSDNIHNGIIAIHEECWDGNWGDTRSDNDPDQGWEGEYEEDNEE